MNVKTILVQTRDCLDQTGTIQALGYKGVLKRNSSESMLGPECGPGPFPGPAETHLVMSAQVRRRPKRGTRTIKAIFIVVTRVTRAL